MAITRFNDATSRQVAAAKVQVALKTLESELGVKIQVRGFQYSPTSFIMKVEMATVDATGAAQTVEKAAFEAYASMFGLAKTDFGRKFSCKGTTYEITGLNPGAPKFPIQGKRVWDGKCFKFPARTVLAGLPVSAAIAA